MLVQITISYSIITLMTLNLLHIKQNNLKTKGFCCNASFVTYQYFACLIKNIYKSCFSGQTILCCSRGLLQNLLHYCSQCEILTGFKISGICSSKRLFWNVNLSSQEPVRTHPVSLFTRQSGESVKTSVALHRDTAETSPHHNISTHQSHHGCRTLGATVCFMTTIHCLQLVTWR